MARLTRTLEYRRTRWFADGQDLEALTRQAWNLFGTQLERTITRNDDSSISGLRSDDLGVAGFAIHCARYKDQQGVGTIPMVPIANADVGERPPEQNENFMQTDFMALLRGNNVIVLNAGRNAASLRDFLAELFRIAGFPDGTRQFDIARIGDLDKLAMIDAIGVKTIDLNVDIATASADVLGDAAGGGMWSTVTHHISESFRAIIEQDEEINNLRTAEKGTVTVSINVKMGDLEAAKSGLNHLADAIAGDDEADDFVITLRNSQKIRPSEVTVQKSVRLDEMANSVSVQNAWIEMRAYIDELTENGQIEA